jgi:hypothetical protein
MVIRVRGEQRKLRQTVARANTGCTTLYFSLTPFNAAVVPTWKDQKFASFI